MREKNGKKSRGWEREGEREREKKRKRASSPF